MSPAPTTLETRHRLLKPYQQLALDFAQALVDGNFPRAASFLAPNLTPEYSPETLAEHLHGMYELYAKGPPTQIWFDEQFSHEDGPRAPDDLGWVYVGIQGDDFNEAIAVTVCLVKGSPRIREIEWGRP